MPFPGSRPRAVPLFLLLASLLGLLAWIWTRAGAGSGAAVALGGPLDSVDAPRAVRPSGPAPGDAPQEVREALSQAGELTEDARAGQLGRADVAEPSWIDVRIVDRESGASVAGASVFQYRPEGVLETLADGEGGLRLAALGVPIRVRHGSYVDVFAPRIPQARPLRIELTRRLKLAGRLLDPASVGIAGVSVRLDAGPLVPGLDLDEEPAPDRLTRSGEDGRFVFGGLRPADYTLLIAENDDRFAARFEERIEVWPERQGERIFVLDAGATLHGQVRWRLENVPVADVRIEVSPAWELWDDCAPPVRIARTDADGRFEIAGLARTTHVVRVRAPWGATLEREVVSPGAGETFECTLELRRPAQVSGRVHDSSGERVVGARVWITSRPDGRTFDWGDHSSAKIDTPFLLAKLTDGSGAYHFDAVPTREALWILALAPGPPAVDERPAYFEPLRLIEGQARTGLDLSLAGGVQLAGVVTDEGGRPLVGVQVEAWHVRWGRTSPGRTASTDASGRFSVGPLPFGAARIEFSCEGYRDAVQSARLVEGDEQVLEQELVQAHPLTGWVVDGAGLGISAARVRARAVALSGAGPRRGRATSDAFGAFEIEGLSEGRWMVDASAAGFTPVERRGIEVAVPGAAPLLFELAERAHMASGSVHGEVRWKASGRPVWDLQFSGVRAGITHLSRASFEIHGIRPGRLRLIASAPGMEPLIFDRIEVVSGADLDLGSHEAVSATRVTVAVRGPSGALLGSGTSVWLAPLPVDEQGCGKRQPWQHFVETDSKGIYTHDAVPRCRWRLRLTRVGFAAHSETVRISGRRQTIAVFLKPQ